MKGWRRLGKVFPRRKVRNSLEKADKRRLKKGAKRRKEKIPKARRRRKRKITKK